jgi:hypothetical protein
MAASNTSPKINPSWTAFDSRGTRRRVADSISPARSGHACR